MNYFSEYEQERFNDIMYSYNRYNDEDYEDDDDEEEEDNNNNYKNGNDKSDSLFDENEEEEEINKNNKKTKKRNIYFPNDDNNENDFSSSESEEEKKNNNSIDREYNQTIIKEYKLELDKKYKLYKFPRPKTSDLIYKNFNCQNIYLSKPNNYELIPSVFSSYINIEDMNSSLKLIRPTQHITPCNIKGFEKTINLFGFNVEPFAITNIDINNKDKNSNKIKEYIPYFKIENNSENVKIAQCLKCKGIYHQLSSYCKKIRNESIYQIFSYKCSICKYKSNIFVIEPESKNNFNSFNKQNLYFIPKVNEISGVCPSIEYLINIKNKSKNIKIRNTIQMIIIEINKIFSNDNLIEYIYQSLYQILKENELKDKEINQYFKYSLIAYDSEKIYFMRLNNKNYLEITIMNDYINPFCPLASDKLFYNKKDILILLDKFYYWLLEYKNKNKINNSIKIKININTVINSISHLLNINNSFKIYYHHFILFSFSYPNLDLNYLKNKSHFKFYISLFLTMNKLDKNIPFINNIIIHNIKLYYYQIDYKDNSDIKQKYEKLYYDLFSLLSNDSYKDYIYDIKYIISYDKSFFINKTNKNDEPIFISFFPNKKNLLFLNILSQYGSPDPIQKFLFQFTIEYYSLLDNYQHIRVLSWCNHVSDKTKEIFTSYDQDTLFRISLCNYIYDLFIKENMKNNNIIDINFINKIFIEINNKNESPFLEIEKNLKEKLVNTIIKYRREVNNGKDFNMILMPSTLKNICLYYFSFFKQIISGQNLNLFNLLFNEPITTFIKNIYPNILSLKYSPNNKKEKFYLKPSTIYNLHRNQLLLIDNGNYINLLINDKINEKIINHFLINYDIKESNKSFDFEFFCENNYLKNIVINKPIKYIFINDNNVSDNNILIFFIEDSFVIKTNQINKTKSFDNLSYYEYFISIYDKVSNYFSNI